jgi:hypothetical protein
MHEGVLDNYYLKGGVAMELRFAEERAQQRMSISILPASEQNAYVPFLERWRLD